MARSEWHWSAACSIAAGVVLAAGAALRWAASSSTRTARARWSGRSTATRELARAGSTYEFPAFIARYTTYGGL